MTPQEALAHLARFAKMDGWEFEKACGLSLETIASMTMEWGVEYTGINHGNRHVEFYTGIDSKDKAEYQFRRMVKMGMKPRIVHRYVTGASHE